MKLLLFRREHYEHVHSFKLRSHFDSPGSAPGLLETLQQRKAEFLVGNLPPAEMHGCLHLVPVVQNARSVVLLEVIVVLVSTRSELDFLYGNKGLFSLGLLLFLLLLVLELAEVDNATD